jgi:hypothetical protein
VRLGQAMRLATAFEEVFSEDFGTDFGTDFEMALVKTHYRYRIMRPLGL